MQATDPSPASADAGTECRQFQAALELQGDGLTVRLSFSAACPEFSTPSSANSQAGYTPPAAQLASGPAVVHMAVATEGLLRQAFEEASSIVQLSWALQAQDKLRDMHTADATGGAA